MSATPAQRPDALGRAGALAVATVRIGIGTCAFAFTRPALARLGFDRPGGATVLLARLAGGRDIALGLHALAVRNDRDRLAEASAIATAVDAGDAIAFGAALVSRDGIDRTAATNVPLIAAAVVGGGWISARLRG